MLILSRGCDSSVQIGPNITVKVIAIQKQRVKLGIDAPSHIRVLREEIAASDTGEELDEYRHREGVSPDLFPILVVEDDPAHARLIAKALEQCSLFCVTVAPTGAAALEAMAKCTDSPQSRPRLVFLDYYLPDMPGVEVLRRIRCDPQLRTMPVVVLSAEQRESVVAECLEAGANAFVSKAAHFEDFRRSVTRAATFWSSECCVPGPGAPQPAR